MEPEPAVEPLPEPDPIVEPEPPMEPEPIIEPEPEPVEPEPVIEPDTAGVGSPIVDHPAADPDEPTDPPRAVIDAGEMPAKELDPHAGWESDDDQTIHADPESGLYHTPDSPGYKLGPDGQVFESEEEAQQAGFTRWDQPDDRPDEDPRRPSVRFVRALDRRVESRSRFCREGPVAQLVSAPPCHGGGRRFESGRGRRESPGIPRTVHRSWDVCVWPVGRFRPPDGD